MRRGAFPRALAGDGRPLAPSDMLANSAGLSVFTTSGYEATVPVESYPTYFRVAMFPPAAVLSDGTSGRGQPAAHRLSHTLLSPSRRGP
jgi:hypothetical protein